MSSFNPRPPLLAGETPVARRRTGRLGVSIHARHYWRARQVFRNAIEANWLFQSTPAITGGRDTAGWWWFLNPGAVSIHARHYWRARPL